MKITNHGRVFSLYKHNDGILVEHGHFGTNAKVLHKGNQQNNAMIANMKFINFGSLVVTIKYLKSQFDAFLT